MSSMEPDVQDFLKKIVASLFAGLIWLIVNMTLGIYFGLFFIEDGWHAGNIICYIFAALTLVLLLRWQRRVWKKKFPHG